MKVRTVKVRTVKWRASRAGLDVDDPEWAPVEVETYSCGVPGLSVLNWGESWNVNHNASGMAVLRGLTSKAAAIAAAKELAPLADWKAGRDALKRIPWLAEKREQVQARHDPEED